MLHASLCELSSDTSTERSSESSKRNGRFVHSCSPEMAIMIG